MIEKLHTSKHVWQKGTLAGMLYGLLSLQACYQSRSENNSSAATKRDTKPQATSVALCHVKPPSRLASVRANTSGAASKKESYEGMIQIPGGTYSMGADNKQGRPDEYPKHTVRVNGFWMDATEVTNAQFAQFVKATGYVTTAERKPDWEEMRKQLPPGTPRPADEVLIASSLVFKAPPQAVSLNDYSQWWQWTPGADWRHPGGPGSSIIGKEHHPVVHVSWDDAVSYAIWAGKRLPTEAEWEWAARGGKKNTIYPWGNEPVETGKSKANSWQGHFPNQNTKRDGFYGTAPVKSFAPNGYGLFDMAGNVWEWCADFYRGDYYQSLAQHGVVDNPKGPSQSFDPDEPTVPKRVQRGGSFLCNDDYCSSYRSAARMKSSPDTGLSHSGFRCVKN